MGTTPFTSSTSSTEHQAWTGRATPPPAPCAAPIPRDKVAAIADWLDTCERAAAHPASIDSQLRRQGWSPTHAAAVAEQYRQRFDEHALGYTGLLVATGLAGLAAGTAGHLLTAGIDGRRHRGAGAHRRPPTRPRRLRPEHARRRRTPGGA